MVKFRFYILDEDGDVTGTNSGLVALECADFGYTVIDTETGKYGDNTDQFADFVDVDEAISPVDVSEEDAD